MLLAEFVSEAAAVKLHCTDPSGTGIVQLLPLQPVAAVGTHIRYICAENVRLSFVYVLLNPMKGLSFVAATVA